MVQGRAEEGADGGGGKEQPHMAGMCAEGGACGGALTESDDTSGGSSEDSGSRPTTTSCTRSKTLESRQVGVLWGIQGNGHGMSWHTILLPEQGRINGDEKVGTIVCLL